MKSFKALVSALLFCAFLLLAVLYYDAFKGTGGDGAIFQ